MGPINKSSVEKKAFLGKSSRNNSQYDSFFRRKKFKFLRVASQITIVSVLLGITGCLSILTIPKSYAATNDCIWTNNNGSGDNHWSTSTNWSCGNVPTNSNNVILNGTYNYNLTIDAPATAASFQSASDYSGTIAANSNLTLTISGTGSGNFTLTAGTYVGTGNLIVEGGSIIGDGTLSMTDGTATISGTGNFGGASDWSFNNLTFGDGLTSGTSSKTGNNKITVKRDFLVAANHTLDTSSSTWDLSPDNVSYLTGITKIASGGYHTMAIDSAGAVYTWGAGTLGQLGNGTNVSSNIAVKVLGGEQGGEFLANITQISAGETFSMAVDTTGAVYTWGRNDKGQLGNGNTSTNRNTPVRVLKGAQAGATYLSNIVQVAGGMSHAMARDNTGAVYTWGWNLRGQLGDWTTTDKNIPVRVAKGAQSSGTSYLSNIVEIAAGNNHSIVLDDTGQVFNWGWNFNWQLGDQTTNQSNAPMWVWNKETNTWLTGIGHIAGGAANTLALGTDGAIWFWGGLSSFYNSAQIMHTQDATAEHFANATSIEGGYIHSSAIKNTGEVYTWGSNDYGELGNGNTGTSEFYPIRVLSGQQGIGSYFSDALQVSDGYNSSAALDNSGSVYTWGWNVSGALGNGTFNDTNTPVRVIRGMSGVTINGTLLAQNSNINAFGYWTNNATFTAGTSNVDFKASNITQNLSTGGIGLGKSFNDLAHSGTGTLRLANNELGIISNFTNSAGSFDVNSFDVTISGNWLNSATFVPGAGTVIFNKSSDIQTLDSGGTGAGKPFNNITHSDNGTLQLIVNDISIYGNLNNSSGTFDTNGQDITLSGNFGNTGNLSMGNGDLTFNATTVGKTITLSGQSLGNTIFSSASGGWQFQDAASITGDLTILNSEVSGNGVNFNNQTIIIDGSLTLGGGKLTAGSSSVSVSGSWTRTAGEFIAGTSTIIFNSDTTSNTINSGGNSFYNITFDNTAGGWTIGDSLSVSGNLLLTASETSGFGINSNNQAINIEGDLNITGGKLTAGNSSITVGGSWQNQGTFDAGASTVKLSGLKADPTVNNGDQTFYNLSVEGQVMIFFDGLEDLSSWTATGKWHQDSDPACTLTGASGAAYSTGCLGGYDNDENSSLISPAFILPSGSKSLYFDTKGDTETNYDYLRISISTDNGENWTELDSYSGNWNWNKKTIDLTSYASATAKLKFTFTSDGSYITSGVAIDNVQVGELMEPSTIVYSLTASISVLNDLTINSGGFNAGNNNIQTRNFLQNGGVFVAPGSSNNLTVTKDFSVGSGTFTHNSGNVVFKGAEDSTISGSTIFHNLIMDTSVDGAKNITFTAATTQNINGIWTLNGEIGKILTLRSTIPTSAWEFIIPSNMTSGSYIDVQDSQNNTNEYRITAGSNVLDSSNNTPGWIFGLVYLPTLNIAESTLVTTSSANLNAGISATGGSTISERGFEYGLNQSGAATVKETGDYGAVSYSLPVSALSANTTYVIRAYAINSAGTGYSSWSSFRTLEEATQEAITVTGGGDTTTGGGGDTKTTSDDHTKTIAGDGGTTETTGGGDTTTGSGGTITTTTGDGGTKTTEGTKEENSGTNEGTAPIVPITTAIIVILSMLGASTLSSLSNIFSSWGEAAKILGHPFFFLGTRNKRKDQFGRVLDLSTGLPLALAKVELFKLLTPDESAGKLVATTYSDKEGFYAFVREAGLYKLKITKENYQLGNEKGYYEQGQVIELKSGQDSFVREQVAMYQGAQGQNNQIHFVKEVGQLAKTMNTVSFLLLVAGTIWYIVEILRHQTATNYLIVILYLAIWIYSLATFIGKRNTIGKVLEQYTRHPIALALVRIFNTNSKKLEKTIVSDLDGKIAVALTKDRYQVYCAKTGYQKMSAKEFNATDRFASLDLQMELEKGK